GTARAGEADMQGVGRRWAVGAAATTRVPDRLPWPRGNGQRVVSGEGLSAGVALDRVRVEARGAVEDLRLDARAASAEFGTLAVQGSARRGNQGWGGELADLHLVPARGADWQLQAPARWSQRGSG